MFENLIETRNLWIVIPERIEPRRKKQLSEQNYHIRHIVQQNEAILWNKSFEQELFLLIVQLAISM